MSSLFGFVLFTYEVLLLLKGKISSSELIFANPGESFVAVIELTLTGRKFNVRMFLENAETVVTVDD